VQEIFLDTAYAIALSAPTDEFHQPAVHLAVKLEPSRFRLVTTRAILLEIGSALARQRHRSKGTALLRALEDDPTVIIVPISEEIYRRAFLLFAGRSDKEWSLTDCLSFIVMDDRQIRSALTTDEHFLQAGFRALMRESSPQL
jgi:predicted nucleic acid-binding protein